MQTKTSQKIRVGIFVSIGLLLSMLVIFLLGNGVTLFERQYYLYGRFPDISGLRLDAAVFLAGIQVRKVDEFIFPRNLEEREVIVKFQIKRRFHERIREDSLVSITTQGLLGDKAIFISMGTPAAAVMNDGETLKVKPGLSFEALSDRSTELLDNMNRLAKNIDGLVSDIKKGEGLVGKLIYDPESKKILTDLTQVTHSAQGIIREIQSGRGTMHALIYDPVRKDIGQSLSQTAENLQSASKNFNSVTARIERGEGSVGGLINDPTVYYDLMTLLGKANRNKLLRTVIRATLATNEKDTLEK